MAKYLVLIYGDEREWAAMSAQERRSSTRGIAPSSRRPGRRF